MGLLLAGKEETVWAGPSPSSGLRTGAPALMDTWTHRFP